MGPGNKLKKTARKVDQGLTAHSILRDTFARRASVIDLLLMLLSAVLTFLSFADDALKEQLLPPFLLGRAPLSVLALSLFIVSIAQWRIGWKEKSAAHAEAASALARFKHELTKTLGVSAPVTDEVAEEHLTHYEYINESIAKIPDRDFLRLKKAHRVKVEVSSLLDDFPGSLIFILKTKIFFRDNLRISCPRRNDGDSVNGSIDKPNNGEENRSGLS